jgi:hypothetical protein
MILSASRIKTFLGCSWKYWSLYHLKIPNPGNQQSSRGTICHSIFELLLKKKHRRHYDQIVLNGTIKASPVISRLVHIYGKREKLNKQDSKGEDNFKLIDEMILLGLRTDFFCEGRLLEVGELEIKIESPEFSLLGFIDKLAKCPDGTVQGWDYKSSARNSEDHSIQALTYSLWIKRVLRANSIIKFLFLRFPSDPIVDYSFSDLELDGFEEYIKSLYSYLDSFNESDAKKGFAYDLGYPKKEEGFCKRLACGYASYPKQRKKDGSEYFNCSAKFPFKYWHRIKDGKVIESSKEPLVANEGEEVVEKFYSGCPKWN